ncbi:MAG: hypothetical protein ACI965_000388 [Paraglaciecola sp.]|jgi:hypothetical protein
MHLPFAKATFVNKVKHWKIFCQGRDGKWHRYKLGPLYSVFEEFIPIVREDANGCFFG